MTGWYDFHENCILILALVSLASYPAGAGSCFHRRCDATSCIAEVNVLSCYLHSSVHLYGMCLI